MPQYDELAQYLLVEKARLGDQMALSELIRQHRGSMLKWANQVVHNHTKAEDIVQDALIQTLRRIGSLEEPQKFMPWLRTLVRNQALMSIRSSENRRETPSSLSEETGVSLFSRHGDDPFIQTLSKLTLEQVESKLSQLGEREREVVNAHLLAGLSMNETTEKLGIKNNAFYTALSRARMKLSQYRYEDEIESLISARRRSQKPSLSPTIPTRYLSYASAYDTMSATLTITTSVLGFNQLDLTDVMAATGHAFHLHATPDLGISGPYAYDWLDSIRSGWSNLCSNASVYGGPGSRLQSPDELSACMEKMFFALENGVPVMIWSLNNAEFGIVTGYDDQAEQWTVLDTAASGKKVPYRKLLQCRDDTEWFVAIPSMKKPSGLPSDNTGVILAQAVRNLRGQSSDEEKYVLDGKNAYRRWIDAFHRQQVSDPLSVAYNIAVAAESRVHATRYMNRLANADRKWPSAAYSALHHAARLFQMISEDWTSVSRMYPLPFGADPTAPGPANRAARLLDRAASNESQAADALEETAHQIAKSASR